MSSPNQPYRKLTKTGMGSYYITLPKKIIKALGWREKQKLKVKQSGKKIISEDY